MKKGCLCAFDMKLNPTKVNNYMALYANRGGISLTKKSIAKTNVHWTAEHPSIGTMALIMLLLQPLIFMLLQMRILNGNNY